MACWAWGKYLGDEAITQGVDVCVSSWTRIAPNTLPALAKAGANYMNSQLIRMEADSQRLCGRHRAGCTRVRQRRLGRKHLRGTRWQNSDAAVGRFRVAGHYAGHHREDRRATWTFRWWKRSFRANCSTSPMKYSSPERPRRLPRFAQWIASRGRRTPRTDYGENSKPVLRHCHGKSRR